MLSRITVLTVLLLFWAGCGHSRPFEVLSGPPSAAYRTLGMVSGQGENRSSAVHAAAAQAERLAADAMIVVGERPVGRVIIVTGKAIQYLAPPPQ